MGDLTKKEIASMKAKEAGWKKEAEKASAIHDAAVMDSIKAKFGMGQPAPTPAPVDTMGSVTGPSPAGPAAGMKKGGKVAGKLATRGYGKAR